MTGSQHYPTERFLAIQRLLCSLAVALVLILFLPARSFAADAQQPPVKRVLLISTGSRLGPGFILVDQQILQAFAAARSVRIETYAENIDIVRFPAERTHRIFAEYLAEKYAEYPPDLVVLVFVGNLGITGQILTELFPGTPIVVAGYTEEDFSTARLGKHVSGLAQRVNPEATLQLMLRLQPDLKRIVVVGGTADVDRQVLQRAEHAARPYTDRVQVELWRNRTIDEVRQAVTALPPKTAVLYTRMFRDAAGVALSSGDVGRWIGQHANAPVYALSDPVLGSGAVGGSMASAEALGKRAGELARRILTGTPPDSLPFEVSNETVPMFDWRALKRWGISETLLPPGSIVRFKAPSIWEAYRWYIAAALVILFAQSATILGLAVQRRRRRRIQSALAENQQLMELATSAGELGLWSRDLEDNVLWANPAMRALFGFGPNEEIKFSDVVSRVHPDDRARVGTEVERAQAAGLPFETEYRAVLPDGTERWVVAKGRTMPGAGDAGTHRLGVIFDITQRKHTEQKLRESEDSFRRLVESTRVVIWEADPESWLFTYVSPYAFTLLGYPVERWYEKDFWVSHIHPADRDTAVSTCVTMSESGEEFDFEYRMIDASGRIVWVHDIVNRQYEHEPRRLRGLMFDITERKHAEQALRESQASLDQQRAFLRQVIDTDPNFIFAKDREGRFTLANQAVADAFGAKVDDLIGKTDADLNPNRQEVEFFRRIDMEVINTGEDRFIPEERITDAHGNVRWLQTVKRPILGSDGSVQQVLGASTDITWRKKAEIELQEQRAELAHVERVSLMGELAASLAHELNQPLTAILMNAQAALRFMARDPSNLDEVRESLADIVKANSRAAEVIRRMRVLVKKEETLDFTTLDLSGLVCDIVSLAHSDALIQNVRVSLELEDNLPPVRGDRVQLQQVVLNILLNAFDAMKECPAAERAVTIRVENADGMNRVAVSDCGPGLTDDALEKIFQPFFTTKREGLGMGLSICRSIIRAHGGSLDAQNNSERGATFYFTVPVDAS